MIDHLLMFPSAMAAAAALEPFGYALTSPAGTQWDMTCTLPGVSVATPAGAVPGYWVAIALPELSATLTALPQCRVASDREAAAVGGDFFVYVAPGVDLQMLASATVSPVYAGSGYMF